MAECLPLDKAGEITLSITSHGHGHLVEQLLKEVLTQPTVAHVILTLNVDESLDLPFNDRLEVVRNASPQGFGANHNAAFTRCKTPYFCVLNPDISLSEGVFETLAECLRITRSALAAPRVLSPDGSIEDSWRRFPTFIRLVCKAFGHDTTLWPQKVTQKVVQSAGQGVLQARAQSSVVLQQRGIDPHNGTADAEFYWPDWVAGMCMLFDSESFRAIKGFDEGFFLYYEDVDICARLWRSGSMVVACPAVSVTHDAQRASRHNWQHMRWHAQSMARYFWKYTWRLPKTKTNQ
jgi:GT2 family glycosyltransferase